MCHVSSKIDLH